MTSNYLFALSFINLFHDYMLDFRGLETFYWVLTLGSFGKAARKLNTTQPAVSHRIAALEAELGGKLLTRNARHVVATARGRELLVYAEKLLGMRAELIGRIGDPSTARGVLRLGVTETLVHTWLSAFIKALNRTYPDLTIEIEVDITSVLRERLMAQEIELAFLLGPLSASTVRNASLCTYRLAFLASPALRVPQGATLQDLARHAIFTFPRHTAPYERLRALLRDPGVAHVSLNSSTSLSTIVRLAVDGLGVAAIPTVIVGNELKSGALAEIRTDVALPDLNFSASWLATPDALLLESVAGLAVRTAVKWPGS
jgi:DNA-binding transcriptional LysR family regulator